MKSCYLGETSPLLCVFSVLGRGSWVAVVPGVQGAAHPAPDLGVLFLVKQVKGTLTCYLHPPGFHSALYLLCAGSPSVSHQLCLLDLIFYYLSDKREEVSVT